MGDRMREYKGYTAKVTEDPETGVLYGKIAGIRDLITFEVESAELGQRVFEEAVNTYLAFCWEVGKAPERP